jgi:hypothetical protein
MRTTLTIEDSLARALRDLAHRTRRSFKDVVNETLRAGLKRTGPRKSRSYALKPRHLGGVQPGIDLDRALRLADTLEELEIARKLQLRK